jgi:Cellulase (glycosyl hydrolase family 5)
VRADRRFVIGLALPATLAAAISILSGGALSPVAPAKALADDNSPTSAPGPYQFELTPDGIFALNYHGVALLNMYLPFWEAKWKWANPGSEMGELTNGKAPFSIRIPGLAADFGGRIEIGPPNVLTYEGVLRHSATPPDVIGGGMEFDMNFQSRLFAEKTPSEPELLPNNEGFVWRLPADGKLDGTDPAGQEVKVVFTPGVRRVFFENGNKNRIRAFLIEPSNSSGTEHVRMTVTFPAGTRRRPSEVEEYGPIDAARWLRNVFPSPHVPVDLSTLNHRPGTHGFLKRVGDRLQFEDGTPARFWGINVMAYALFSSNDQIAKHARRLAMLGFNLVRLHHHDSTRWVSPTVIDKHADNSRKLDPVGMDRVDYWIKCLRDNGIYVWLDMHSYREFRPGDRSTELGEVVTFGDLSRSQNAHEAKGFCQYDPGLQKLFVEFEHNYLSHVNHYTGLAYKDDPTVAFVLITNENDITHHYGVRAMGDQNNVALSRLFHERTRAFAEQTGIDERHLQSPWSPGPAQMFLNDQEHTFDLAMIEGIRGAASKALIATGHMWGDNPLASVSSLTTGDIIDTHEYDGPGLLEADPRYKANILSWIGLHRVEGFPITVSEWNMASRLEPTVDRFAAPLCVASIAALQGWDALMMYGYSQQVLADQVGLTSVWDTLSDPALMAMMPAAAMIYRNGHVSEARKHYTFALSPEQLFDTRLRPDTCVAARTLIEQSHFALGIPPIPQLPWLKPQDPPPKATVIHDPVESFLAADAHSVTSDTGELKRDWEAGTQTIDTPKTQAAQGAILDRAMHLSDVTILVHTRHAAVAVSAMDERPINSSNQILITTVAEC